jgi:hypothetical protein
MDDRTWISPAWRRTRRVLSVLSMATLTVGGTQLVAATSADAATTVVYSVHKTSSTSSEPRQRAFARCNPGDMLVGTGAMIPSSGDEVPVPTLKLTSIRPVVTPSAGVDDGVWALAEEPSSGYDDPWSVTAIAICAEPGGVVRDAELVTAVTEPSRAVFKQTAAVCPSGKRATGSGAAVQISGGSVGDGNRQLGLQLNRTSGPMDISRAAAATAGETPVRWSLFSYAICASPIPGAAVHGTLATAGDSVTCADGKRVLSVGGGGSLTYPGPSFLYTLYTSGDLRTFSVSMTGVPYPEGGVAVGAVCAPV